MRVTLSVYRHTEEADELLVERFPLIIGRSPEADLTLDDRWVSRRHCELYLSDGNLYVRDIGSKHGILVNDSPVSDASLGPGDTLNVGLSIVVPVFEGHACKDEREAEIRS